MKTQIVMNKTLRDGLKPDRVPVAEAGEGGSDKKRLKKAVNEFEALFINHMLKTMRSTVLKSGLFKGGMREDIYTSLFDWEISKDMAAAGGVGLGKMLLKDFLHEK